MSTKSSPNEKPTMASNDANQEVHLNARTENIFTDDSVDPVYRTKARILNDAIQEIGIGRYQCYQIVTGLILPPVLNEFAFRGPFLKLGQNIGLLIGAVFWGVGSDVWGRKYVHP
ncbi:hypothetical protein H0H87_010019 [Tephrocybe sp. NHM501043]|nr:hypothetical protein H0H87_010019 [Tephrocybe sp. NHM501043]